METPAEIDIEDFAKVELKTARVLKVEDHPNADRLLVFTVAAGEEERTICAGVKGHVDPAEMVGRDIVIVANLKPISLRGVMSQGMLLAVQDGDAVIPLTAMKQVQSGLRVS